MEHLGFLEPFGFDCIAVVHFIFYFWQAVDGALSFTRGDEG
jgi:hypothetical protein